MFKYSTKKLQIYIDGPYGAPASNFFRAQHGVLVSVSPITTNFVLKARKFYDLEKHFQS
jgi:hypothetical protein